MDMYESDGTVEASPLAEVIEIDWTASEGDNFPVKVKVTESHDDQTYEKTYGTKSVIITSPMSQVYKEAESMYVPSLPGKKDAIENVLKLEVPAGYEAPKVAMGLYKRIMVQLGKDKFNAANIPNTEFFFVLRDPVDQGNIWWRFDYFKEELYEGSRTFGTVLVTDDYNSLVASSSKLVNHTKVNTLIRETLIKVLQLDDVKDCERYPVLGASSYPLNLKSPPDDLVDASGSSGYPNEGDIDCVYQIFDGQDPEYGVWETLELDWTVANYKCLMADLPLGGPPLPDCTDVDDAALMFASDGMCDRYGGYQQGAWMAGLNKATKVINKKLTTEQKAIWAPSAQPLHCFSDTTPRILRKEAPPVRKPK
eukprot:scaffold3782_cov170-Amphora_coffeaeformis.AAC.13